MYIVTTTYSIKRYTASMARERLAEALDHADRGIPVVMERKGVRYRITREFRTGRRSAAREPRREILDSPVANGQWTGRASQRGLAFRPRRQS